MFRRIFGVEKSPSVPRVSSNQGMFPGSSRKQSTQEDRWGRSPVCHQLPFMPTALCLDYSSATAFIADHVMMGLLDISTFECISKVPYTANSIKTPISPVPVNAEWNPISKGLIVMSSGTSIHIIRSNNIEPIVEQTKKAAHKRPITDLDWSRTSTNMFISAAQEEYLLLWDCRTLQKPAISFSSLVPASRVKFNKVDDNIIASCHDNAVYLWDKRQPKAASQFVGTHSMRVFSLDWSPSVQSCLVSAAHDQTVKLWTVSSSTNNGMGEMDKHLLLKDPAWIVLFSPLGDSLMTAYERSASMSDCGFTIWNMRTSPIEEVRSYNTVSPVIKMATSQLTKTKECKLIALLKNGTIQSSSIFPMASGTSSDHLDSISLHEEYNKENSNLQNEFNQLLAEKPANTDFVKMDAAKRSCLIIVTVSLYEIEITIQFPKDYPKNVPPIFSFSKGSNLQSTIKAKLQKVLRITSAQHVSRNQPCLEYCLKQLIKTLESIKSSETTNKGDVETDAPKLPPVPVNIYGGEQDSSVPFPRTSGARFCGANFLVCFTRPSYIQKNQRESDADVTPRSLSALGAYIKAHRNPLSPRSSNNPLYPSFVAAKNDSQVSISSFYYNKASKRDQKKKISTISHSYLDKVPSAAVLIYSMPGILPVSYALASRYKLDANDPLDACKHNIEVAKDLKRSDLVQVWTLAAQIVDHQITQLQSFRQGYGYSPADQLPWPMHVFGRKLAEHLIDRYLKLYDIQTVAMLCCVFGEVPRRQKRRVNHDLPTAEPVKKTSDRGIMKYSKQMSVLYRIIGSTGSPSNTITQSMTNTAKNGSLRDLFSTLETYGGDEPVSGASSAVAQSPETDSMRDDDSFILNPSLMARYDQLKHHYAEILYKWNLLEQRCLVLNHISTQQTTEKSELYFRKTCVRCKADNDTVTCGSCRWLVFRCVICDLGVRGSSYFCLMCYHGGHTEHMRQWFQNYSDCPTGCGCECIGQVIPASSYSEN